MVLSRLSAAALISLASVVVEEPFWKNQAGIEAAMFCREILERARSGIADRMCPEAAEKAFRIAFPGIVFKWPACGKKTEAEQILWMAVYDRGYVDRYVQRLLSLCDEDKR